MPLSEHVYCVVITFKMTERGEQQTCIKFCFQLEHSSVETIQVTHKAAVVGNWWLSASSWQWAHSCITSRAEFLANHQVTRMTQILYSPDLAPWDFWLFPKLKSLLKGKRFQTLDEIQKNMTGQLMVIGRTVWGPNMPTLKGTEVSLSYVRCFLYIISFSINVFILHITWLDTFWTGLVRASFIPSTKHSAKCRRFEDKWNKALPFIASQFNRERQLIREREEIEEINKCNKIGL